MTATLHGVKLVIIDRDGVVSRAPNARSVRPESWKALPGSAAAIARLTHAGHRVALLGDCEPIARGACDMAGLAALHSRIIDEVAEQGGTIDAVLLVTATDAANRTKAVSSAIREWCERIDPKPASAVLVSDSRAELDAAGLTGCRPVLVLSGHGCETLDGGALPDDTIVRVDLSAVAAELAP